MAGQAESGFQVIRYIVGYFNMFAPWMWRVVVQPIVLAMLVAGVAKAIEIAEALGLWNAPTIIG